MAAFERLGSEARKLKLGESFSRNSQTAFHTFRYDFKPASVDTKKVATVEIGKNSQTTVTVPHVEGSGSTHTVFKGVCRPYNKKECLLIIDNVTGEIVLERLSGNVQVKKIRAESSSKSLTLPNLPAAMDHHSSNSNSSRKSSPPQKFSPNPVVPSQSPVDRSSPNRVSPKHKSPPNLSHRSPASQRSPTMPGLIPSPQTKLHSTSSNYATVVASNNSMPLFTCTDYSVTAAEPMDESSQVGILSDSSSDSSAGENSSESDSELPSKPNKEAKKPTAENNHYPAGNLFNMPRLSEFHQLNDDLRLSESESDSDC